MHLSRISDDAQVTVPQPVLEALDLKPGDSLAYIIDGRGLVRIRSLREAATDPFSNPFAMFTEWADPLDDVFDHL